MSHLIDTTTGQAAIAYVGAKPWHGLGQQLPAGADIDTWCVAAGLNFTVEKADVNYTALGAQRAVAKRSVLFRNDTGADLGLVSDRYKIHQPRDIMNLFGDIANIGGFELETAGALDGGKRIWALAKVGAGAKIVGQDIVNPYVLLATSFDGSLPTIGKPTAVRVVCHNTISMALRVPATANKAAGILSEVRIPHRSEFDAQLIKDRLGIVHGAFAQFVSDASELAEKGLNDKLAKDFIAALLAPTAPAAKPGVVFDITKTKGFVRILDLFNGQAIGAELTGGKSAWAMLNAVTQFVDHDRGRNRNSGLTSAWFGDGDDLKTTAKDMLLTV